MTWKHSASLVGSLLACAVAAAAAQTQGPAADYKIDPEYTSKSPDGATIVEQYAKPMPDGGSAWQFWARRQDATVLLDREDSDYPAGFRYTNDSRWLIRMQTTGSGEATLYLYRLGPQGFVAATAKPLGDLAWDFFWSRRESRKVMKPDFHFNAGLLKGVDDNYRWMGEKWPENRYIVITLSGDVSPNGHHGQLRSVRGWHCRYDLQKGTFDVPADFAQSNAKAIAPEPS